MDAILGPKPYGVFADPMLLFCEINAAASSLTDDFAKFAQNFPSDGAWVFAVGPSGDDETVAGDDCPAKEVGDGQP